MSFEVVLSKNNFQLIGGENIVTINKLYAFMINEN